MAVNYEALTTGNHNEEAGRLLQETGLDGKEGVTKKKGRRQVSRYGEKLQQHEGNCQSYRVGYR